MMPIAWFQQHISVSNLSAFMQTTRWMQFRDTFNLLQLILQLAAVLYFSVSFYSEYSGESKSFTEVHGPIEQHWCLFSVDVNWMLIKPWIRGQCSYYLEGLTCDSVCWVRKYVIVKDLAGLNVKLLVFIFLVIIFVAEVKRWGSLGILRCAVVVMWF